MSTVFCIGMNKTGTTSLAQALTMLGFKTLHSMRRVNRSLNKSQKIMIDLVSKYDAILDGWMYKHYKELDQTYNGKFILTCRDLDSWIESRIKHNMRMGKPSRNKDKDKWHIEYNTHYYQVRKYFKGKNNLLEIDITQGEGWERLCPFLGKEIPYEPFPYLNVAKN